MDTIKQYLPSNCYSKNKMRSIDGAVIHFISAKNILSDDPFNLEAIMGIFKKYKVSAKYLIRRDGTVIELVPDDRKAYHAGYSRMNRRDDCNSFTESFELEGGTRFGYEEDQILVLSELLAQSMTKNQYTLDWVQGHDKVRSNWLEVYPTKAVEKHVSRKVDPGSHFPWDQLNKMLMSVSDAVSNSND
jgi:N-acetyl-anhydromuramyl-L-alanine amidase AmpD